MSTPPVGHSGHLPAPATLPLPFKSSTDKKVTSVASSLWQALKSWKLIPVFLVGLVTYIGQALYSLASGRTKKTLLFGLTFFNMPLISNGLGLERFGLRYKAINLVAEGILVSRIPLKEDLGSTVGADNQQLTFNEQLVCEKKRLDSLPPSPPPLSESVNWILTRFGVTIEKDTQGIVIDLTEEGETTKVWKPGTLSMRTPATEADWKKHNIGYVRKSFPDFKAANIQDTQELIKLIGILRILKIPVLIHCAKGIGRSATVACAAIAGIGDGITAKRAINQVQANRAIGMNFKQELVIYQIRLLKLYKDQVGFERESTLRFIQNIDKEKNLDKRREKILESPEEIRDFYEALSRAHKSWKSFVDAPDFNQKDSKGLPLDVKSVLEKLSPLA
ncbi:MAG: hypothetical protein NTY13_03705 [Chlamydiae bacterium]|nr:hypothetical protein [Chlamydiota bacterium]